MGSIRSDHPERANDHSNRSASEQGGQGGVPNAASSANNQPTERPQLPEPTVPGEPQRTQFRASEGGLWRRMRTNTPGPGGSTGNAEPPRSTPRIEPWNAPVAPSQPRVTAKTPSVTGAPGGQFASSSSKGSNVGASASPTTPDPRATREFAAVGSETASRPRVTAGSAPMGPRQPSLTAELSAAQARATHAPDVARQAIKELDVLAGELSALAGELESSGLARIHADAYFDLLQRYVALSRSAWLSVAAERLEQDGANQEYRQRAIAIARETTRLRRECEVVASNADFTLPRRVPWRWRRRSRLVTRALSAWQVNLTTPADPQRMGVALYNLRGAVHTALAGGLELTLLDNLSGSSLWLVAAVAVANALSLVGATIAGNATQAAGYAALTLVSIVGLMTLTLLLARGLGSLPAALAGASFSETRSNLNGYQGSTFAAVTLRVWWNLVGLVGAFGGLVGLAAGVLLVLQSPLTHHLAVAAQVGGMDALSALPPEVWLTTVGGLLATLLVPAALVTSLALAALALPTLLVTTWRVVGELGGWRRWAPGARRYALGPALAVNAWVSGGLLGLAWYLSGLFALDSVGVLSSSIAGAPITISARVFALFLALVIPWLGLIEMPFRVGLARWRRAWLRDLTTRKNATESHVRRLSAPDPHTGAQDTSDETLRMMQYDLVLLQFYNSRIEEAQRALSLSVRSTLILALYFLVAALLLDGGSSALVHALQTALGL